MDANIGKVLDALKAQVVISSDALTRELESLQIENTRLKEENKQIDESNISDEALYGVQKRQIPYLQKHLQSSQGLKAGLKRKIQAVSDFKSAVVESNKVYVRVMASANQVD